MESVKLVRAGDLRPAEGTAAMVRKVAIETGGVWAGRVETEPGLESGWHHHGANHSVIYVRDGRIRIDFGPAGRESVEGAAGDFISVPPGVVHREASPEGGSELVVFRTGSGEVLFNVDGPEPASS